MPTMSSGPAAAEQTDLQRSIFDAPAAGGASTDGATAKQATGAGQAAKGAEPVESRGQKRPRDEEEEEEDSDEDVAMEEDSDDEE